MKYVFKGSCVAIITPFKNGKVDFESFEKLIKFQLDNKTDAIVVLGTTGEPATMTQEEKLQVISFVKKIIGKKAKLIVGTGTNSTTKSIEQSILAQENGADALLCVTPYYNKCTQKGLVKHFSQIANSVAIPIIVYNVPSRTGVNILPETALELSTIPNICGIKEASGNISQIVKLSKLLQNKMAIYSGDDSLNYVFMSLGALGCISVTANVLPKQVKFVIDSALNNDFASSRAMHEKLLNINNDLFLEVNPIPVKFACSVLKLCQNELRLPLTQLDKKYEDKIIEDLKDFEN